jgi:hypothetical protein
MPLDKVYTYKYTHISLRLREEVVAVPNKTIYVSDEDEELWEKAKELAGGSVSSLLIEALRRYIEEQELEERQGMEKIEVELEDPARGSWRAQFVGRWLLRPQYAETRTSESGHPDTHYGVALTQRGNIAVYECQELTPQHDAASLTAYKSFREAEEDGVPKDILAIAARQQGADYVERFDF